MRVLIRASIPVEAGTKAIKNGMLPKVMGEFAEKARPEAMYFTLRGGQRTMYSVIDLRDVSQLPLLLEPLFEHLSASVDSSPCMNNEDLQKGMKALGGR